MTKAETRSDKDNCLFSISNILKGSSENSRYFILSNGPQHVMEMLLNLLDSTDVQEKINIVELCVSSIKQLANSKDTFKEFLDFSDKNRSYLMQIIKRCFLLSDNWHTCSKELMRFNKIFNSNQAKDDTSKLQTSEILKLDYKNVESFKALELLEQQEDMSIKMASIVKIRNNVYYTAVGCFKARF